MYCTHSGVNSFIGSGTGGIIGGAPDGEIEVTIYPEADVIIFSCFDFLIEDEDWSTNNFCLYEPHNKRLILSSGVEQRIELNYDHASKENTTVEKIVSPGALSGSWETCQKLGLIRNAGLYTSIQNKIENATRKYEAGDAAAANNIYSALASELEAQDGKGIDTRCASVLREDIATLLTSLASPAP
jgi:hypothetical protein